MSRTFWSFGWCFSCNSFSSRLYHRLLWIEFYCWFYSWESSLGCWFRQGVCSLISRLSSTSWLLCCDTFLNICRRLELITIRFDRFVLFLPSLCLLFDNKPKFIIWRKFCAFFSWILEPIVKWKPIGVLGNLKLQIFGQGGGLVLNITGEDAPHVDGGAYLKRSQEKGGLLVGEVNFIFLEKLANVDANDRPSIGLEV